MCGITGFCSNVMRPDPTAIDSMTNALGHRGPDDHGVWVDTHVGVQLGHRRLSILDLSAAGHQPMLSRQKRFVLSFNGEIYNYRSLARELKSVGHYFTSNCDTEVMLSAFEEWGVKTACETFNGMFAFGLWDRLERTLYLARDRMGEKPLYYGWNSDMFLFASELKAITAHPQFEPVVDPSTAALALRYSYIPAPWSIYRNIFKLVPGTILKLPVEHMATPPPSFTPHAHSLADRSGPSYFWKPPGLLSPLQSVPHNRTFEDAASELDSLLSDAVNLRMVSDVPIGAFLSGGIDSSTIVALMQRHTTRPVKTFSIGFKERVFDEAPYAKQVASHIGTDHTELYVSAKDIFDVIPSLPTIYDEPFGDSSQIPTYLVSKLCSQRVTVSLSGDGGDELFAGYDRYRWANTFWSRAKLCPAALRSWIADFIASPLSERACLGLAHLLPSSLQVGNLPQKLGTASGVLRLHGRRALYNHLMSHWSEDLQVVPMSLALPTIFEYYASPQTEPFINEMTAIDMQTYLPDDIMVKVDRASMAVGLEARTPFLDHRVVEFALRLPLSSKIKNGNSKALLKHVLKRYVPEKLTNRPKMGFSIPIGRWLRRDLRPWAEELLSKKSLESSGFLNPAPIQKRWKQHVAGTHNWEHQLWDVLMLQAWTLAQRGKQPQAWGEHHAHDLAQSSPSYCRSSKNR